LRDCGSILLRLLKNARVGEGEDSGERHCDPLVKKEKEEWVRDLDYSLAEIPTSKKPKSKRNCKNKF